MGSGNGWDFEQMPERAEFGTVIRPLTEKFKEIKSRRRWFYLLAGLVLIGYLAMGVFFQLEPEEEAIVLRLGSPLTKMVKGSESVQTFGPGLHTKIPLIDQVYSAPVNRQHRLEFGFRSEPDVVTKVKTKGYGMESLMLTGDLMLVHVRWSVVYKIEDLHAWLFEIKDREQTIRDISMAVMRQIVGDYSLDEVLTAKQLEIATLAEKTTQAALRDKVPTGVLITEIAVKAAEVPEQAKKAFDDLTRTLARVQGELAEAKAEQDNAIGIARKLKNEAVGKAQKSREQIVENAHGEANAFRAKAAEYQRAPEITKQWMYLQTMKDVLGRLDEKYVIENAGDVSKHLPLKDFISVPKGGK
jgi:membrane protease subunit HflK